MNKLPKLSKAPIGKRQESGNTIKAPQAPASQRIMMSRHSSTGGLGMGIKKPPTGYQFATPN